MQLIIPAKFRTFLERVKQLKIWPTRAPFLSSKLLFHRKTIFYRKKGQWTIFICTHFIYGFQL